MTLALSAITALLRLFHTVTFMGFILLRLIFIHPILIIVLMVFPSVVLLDNHTTNRAGSERIHQRFGRKVITPIILNWMAMILECNRFIFCTAGTSTLAPCTSPAPIVIATLATDNESF